MKTFAQYRVIFFQLCQNRCAQARALQNKRYSASYDRTLASDPGPWRDICLENVVIDVIGAGGVGIHVLESREARLQVGTCEIKGSTEQAAVLAVLDASNRWLGSVP